MRRSHDVKRTDDRARQRGIVLVLALIFLLLSALLAAGAVEQALLQQRMAGSQRSAQLAGMAVESALRGAEWKLWRAASAAPMGDCAAFDPAHPGSWSGAFQDGQGWTGEGATAYRGSDGRHDFTTQHGFGLDDDARRTAVLAQNPSYLIENLGPARPAAAGSAAGAVPCIYRITARATGGNVHIVRVARSIFVAAVD